MNQMRISTNLVSSVMLRPKTIGQPKNCKSCETAGKPNRASFMKVSQNRRRIEVSIREIENQITKCRIPLTLKKEY
jgi:hypothetical protein